jgi:hypothetical protein
VSATIKKVPAPLLLFKVNAATTNARATKASDVWPLCRTYQTTAGAMQCYDPPASVNLATVASAAINMDLSPKGKSPKDAGSLPSFDCLSYSLKRRLAGR